MIGALPTITILGHPALLRDVLQHTIAAVSAGVIVPPESDADVAVLVNPDDTSWEAARESGSCIVLLTEEPLDDAIGADAVLAGADALLTLEASPEQLRNAVWTCAEGGSLLPPRVARLVAARARDAFAGEPVQLTPREVEILQSIERGESMKQTSRSLGIATKTVENLQSRMFRKLDARNRAQAIARAHALGLIDGLQL